MKRSGAYMLLFILALFVSASAQTAAERLQQDQSIEYLRKGALNISVVDAEGTEVPDAEVAIEMQRHDFPFGTCLNLDGFSTQAYLDTAAAYFNHAVHEWEFEWDETEPRQNSVTFEYADRVLNWCRQAGISMRAHAMAWGVMSNVAGWQTSLSSAELLAEMEERVWDIYNHFGDSAYTDVDMINEMCPGKFYQNNVGWDGVARMHELADSLFPTTPLYMNEYDIIDLGGYIGDYMAIADSIIANGGPVEGFGMQAHVITDAGPFNKQVLDLFWETYHKPVKITELVISGDETHNQADEIEEFYRICFAHEAVAGILLWGFWENLMWREDGALWATDWTPTEAGERYVDLVFNQWWTDTALTTDAGGACGTRAFWGNHKITVSAAGQEDVEVDFSFPKDSGDQTITISLDGTISVSTKQEALQAISKTAFRPVVNHGNVIFNIKQNTKTEGQIQVFDVRGRKIWQHQLQKTKPKNHTVTWNARESRIGNGTYFAVFKNGSEKITRKFVFIQ